MHKCVKKEAMTGNSVENCAHWFRFQISANSFVNFFYEACGGSAKTEIIAQI